MEELLSVISDLVSNTPPERIVQLADTVRSLPERRSYAKLKTWAVTPRCESTARPYDDFVARIGDSVR